MQKRHYFARFINILSVFALIYFVGLSYLGLETNALLGGSDYTGLYLSQTVDPTPYHYHQFLITGAKRVKDNVNIFQAFGSTINFNTPPMNMLLKIAMKSSGHGALVDIFKWVALQCLGFIISLIILMRFLKEEDITPLYFFITAVLCWMTAPNIVNFYYGQLSYFILPFLCAAFLSGYYRHWKIMTILISFVAAIKLFFLVFIIFFWIRKEWRLSILFLLGFIFFFFLPLLHYPLEIYKQFFNFSTQSMGFRFLYATNGSVLSTAYIIICGTLYNHCSHISINIIFLLVTTIVLLGFWIYAYQRILPLPEYSYEVLFSFIVLLSIVLSPLAWLYYYIFLFIPAFVLLVITRKYKQSIFFLPFLCLALMLPFGVVLHGKPWQQIIAHFSSFLSLACWFICLVLAARSIATNNQKTISSTKPIMAVFAINMIITVLFLMFNFTKIYFFSVDKKAFSQYRYVTGIWQEVDELALQKIILNKMIYKNQCLWNKSDTKMCLPKVP